MQIDHQDTVMLQMLSAGQDISSCHASQYPSIESFSVFSSRFIQFHRLKRADIIRAAHLEASSGYKFLNGRRPIRQRDTVLRLCIAMGMDCDEAQSALRCCRFAALDPSDLRDYLIILGLHGHQPLANVQLWMDVHNLPAIIPAPK